MTGREFDAELGRITRWRWLAELTWWQRLRLRLGGWRLGVYPDTR